jgi:hypothetical protein
MADAYVEKRCWPAKRGLPRHTLVITYDELQDLLDALPPVSDADDFLEALYEKVTQNDASEDASLRELAAMAGMEGEDEGPLRLRCRGCGMVVDEPAEEDESDGVTLFRCPRCNSDDLVELDE